MRSGSWQQKGMDYAPGSTPHGRVLVGLGESLRAAGQLEAAREKLLEALALIDTLLEQKPNEQFLIEIRASALYQLGIVLKEQGNYPQAQACLQRALQDRTAAGNTVDMIGVLGVLGMLAREQRDY